MILTNTFIPASRCEVNRENRQPVGLLTSSPVNQFARLFFDRLTGKRADRLTLFHLTSHTPTTINAVPTTRETVRLSCRISQLRRTVIKG